MVEDVELDGDYVLYIYAKYGFDGSGAHPTRHHLPEGGDEAKGKSGSHFISSFFCPLELKVS